MRAEGLEPPASSYGAALGAVAAVAAASTDGDSGGNTAGGKQSRAAWVQSALLAAVRGDGAPPDRQVSGQSSLCGQCL